MSLWKKDDEFIFEHKRDCLAMRDFISHFNNPIRLKILCYLMNGKATAGAIVEAVGEKQSTVSQQLKHLYMAGFLGRERSGTNMLYTIENQSVIATMNFLRSIHEDEGDGSCSV